MRGVRERERAVKMVDERKERLRILERSTLYIYTRASSCERTMPVKTICAEREQTTE